MNQPLVSILIPFRNTATFLVDCLSSILKQNYNYWEVLAVDDKSTDRSRLIVEKFSAQDSRIKVFENTGSGIIEALRTAYANSNGMFITRMDSDDVMVPHKLKTMAEALSNYGRGHLAIGKVKYFSDRGISDGYERYEKWINTLTGRGENFSDIYKECVIPSPCWMSFREDLDACDAFAPNRYPEDYDLTFRFYEHNLRCIPCNQILHHWRDYDTRTSRTSEHYAQNYFLDIKLHYFLRLEYDFRRPLTVWGAGNKGKKIAKALRKRNIDFYWLCDNPKKIGKEIYGKRMLHFDILKTLTRPQSIVTVANENAQAQIRGFFLGLEQRSMEDYFFFC